jgi:hypothetical protein
MTQPYGQQPGSNQPGGGGFPPAPAAPAYQQGAGGMPQAPQEYGGGPQRRPGVVTASAVLAFVQAGITTITTILVWIGVGNQLTDGDMIFQAVLAVGQTLGIVLLIWGGVQAMGGKGRTILVAGAALEILVSLLWAVRFAVLDSGGIDVIESAKGVAIFIAILFAVMPVISLVLVMGQQATQYTQSGRR